MEPFEPGPTGEWAELATNFAEISRALYSAHTVRETLLRVVSFSVETIDGCSGAWISFLEDGEITTPVWTEPLVLEVDLLQASTGQGPCLDAIAQETTFYAEDLRTDQRWPTFGPLAAEAGMGCLLSLCLFGDATLGALNLYARRPGAFDVGDRAKGLIFATHAGIALAAARDVAHAGEALEVEVQKLHNLQGALASRQVIGRAEGILMQREHISAEQAFYLLRRASQNLNTKLREVAQYVVDTGDFPEPPA